MIVHTFPSGPLDTNAYLAACPHTKLAAIIDPAPNSFNPLVHALTQHNLKPAIILLTHSHWDHTAEVAPLKAKYNIPVAIHSLDQDNLKMPGSDRLPCWIDIKGVTPDNLLQEGTIVRVGQLHFTVIHTPGHTPGGVCFYCPEEKVLFSGDTLFKGTIGNISFPTAVPKSMWPSLDKLAKLPADTKVYPGHGPSTTIGAENWLPRAEQIFGNDDY